MYTKTFIMTTLLGLASAGPVAPPSPNNFAGIASHSGSKIQGQNIHAAAGKFFLGADTRTACAVGVDCHELTNQTIFTYAPNTQRLYLDVSTPGGQEVYVAKDGSLSFVPAHSHYIPAGSAVGPVQYHKQSGPGHVGSLTFQNKGFSACRIASGRTPIYQVYANSVGEHPESKGCISFGFSTAVFTDFNRACQYV